MPPQIEAVRGDLTLPESLNACMDGVDVVFLVWVAPPATVAPALKRITRSARRIVFLSAPLKTAHPLFQQPNPARNLGLQIERIIEASGCQWTFLRPVMFAANARGWWGEQIRGGDIVRWPYLSVPTAPIDERDIAAVAVRALCEDAHTRAEYVLTGPQSLSQFEQLSTIGRAIGRSLPHRGNYTGSGPARIAQDHACARYQYAVACLGGRKRSACICYIHSRRDHRTTGAHFPRVGHG